MDFQQVMKQEVHDIDGRPVTGTPEGSKTDILSPQMSEMQNVMHRPWYHISPIAQEWGPLGPRKHEIVSIFLISFT